MSEYPWSKFFWSDWESDQGLRLCSLAAQGLWMRILCVCARHEPRGYLAINGLPLEVEDVAQLAGVNKTEAAALIDELDRRGVFSRDRSGRIYSRRMVRDDKRSKEGRKHKNRGLSQDTENKGEISPPSRVPIRGPSPQKPEARVQKEESISLRSIDSEPPDKNAEQGFDLVPPDEPKPDDVKLAFREFQKIAAETGIPAPRNLSEDRRRGLAARLREHGPGAMATAFAAIRASPFLRGENGRDGWTGATLDWLLKPTNFRKVIEGNYDAKPASHRPAGAIGFSVDQPGRGRVEDVASLALRTIGRT